MPPSRIEIHAERTAEEEIERGVAAAQHAFDTAGVCAWHAAVAAFAREAPDWSYDELDQETFRRQYHLANLWDDAVAAARDASRARSGQHSTFDLKLVGQS